MKFSVRQILASAAGAVIAAIIASSFGVKGTIIGVGIGSAAATFGTALVAQSIERGQQAVKQVVVRAPEPSTLLRKLGATGATGDTTSAVDASTTPTEAGTTAGAGAEAVEMESTAAPVGETQRLEISAEADAPATERIDATTAPMQPAARTVRSAGPQRFSWSAIAGTAAVVFVLALMFITAVELISGKPLAAIFGGAGTGTSLKNIITPPPASTTTSSTTTTTSTTSTTTTSSSTTTSTSASTTTSTTVPRGNTTTSTSAATSTTTTSGVGATTTTTKPVATSP